MFDMLSVFLFADRPIASIAFHAQGEFLAVASGHKVRIFGNYHRVNCFIGCFSTLN